MLPIPMRYDRTLNEGWRGFVFKSKLIMIRVYSKSEPKKRITNEIRICNQKRDSKPKKGVSSNQSSR